MLLAYVTFRLVQSTNKLWDAADKAAKTQEKDTRIIQRAYLSVDPGGVKPFVDGSDRAVCNIIIRNAGNLPAKGVSWYIDRAISPQNDLSNFAIPIGNQQGKIVLAPQSAAIKGCRFIPLSDLGRHKPKQAFGPGAWFYIWGRIEYHDGFQAGRFIEFCHRYNLAALNSFNEIDVSTARYHEYGNRTDEG